MNELTSEPTDKPKAKSGKDLHSEAKDRFVLAQDAWSENHKLARSDREFRIPENQWPSTVRREREAANRPCLAHDKLNQYVNQVVNDGRQNRPAVKVRPIDDKGDPKVAEALQGLIRHICDRSDASDAFDNALEDAAASGFGYFRVLTNYAHDNTFDQEIEVGRIRNPLAVLLDPNAQKADGSDARYGFIVDEIAKDRFAEQYPKAKFTDWQADSTKYAEGWLGDSTVRVCEYFYIVEEQKNTLLLEDGTIVTEEDYWASVEKTGNRLKIVLSRQRPVCKVKWCRLSGAEVLEENDWPGKYIPIIPVYGNELDLDGKIIYSGLIRNAKDPQRLYNYSRSAYAERVALAPKAPWVAAAGQIEEYESDWKRAATDNIAVLKYDPQSINDTPVPPPQRVQAADIPAGFAQDMQTSEHDIQASMGMYAASLGQQSNEKSGKAIMARQREGDTATFHYQDNLNRAIRHLGRILVDLAPKIYDAPRVVRILGEDGTSTSARIDPEQEAPVVEMGSKVVYNLGIGTYDVSVAAGPSYTTKRVEAAEAQMEMARANPAVWQTHGDLIAKSQDWPGADEWAKRTKLVMPPELRKVIDAEEDQTQSPEVARVKAEAQQMLDQAQQAIQEREQAMQQLVGELDAMKQAQAGQTERSQAEAAKAAVTMTAKELEAAEKVRLEKARADEAEFTLKREQAMHALEELQEQAIDQIKALLVPTPAVEQPEAAPPPGPSPELVGILEHLNQQSQTIMQGFAAMTAPRVRTALRDEAGNLIGMREEAA